MKKGWLTRLFAWDGEQLPDVAWRVGKTDQYMMPHVFLPTLLWEQPDRYRELLGPDAMNVVHQWWQHVQRIGGMPSTQRQGSVSVYGTDVGSVAVRIDMPEPHDVPLAHAAIVILHPERRCFVLEKATAAHVRRVRPAQWSWISSEPRAPEPVDVPLAYLAEWCSDGDRFNYGLIEIHAGIPTGIAEKTTVCGPWHEISGADAIALLPSSLRDTPLRPAPVPIPTSVLAEAATLIDAATTAKQRELAIIEAIERYGTMYSEISIRIADVMRELVARHELDEAARIVQTWLSFCHAHRGNRAPETRIAFTWDARVRLRREDDAQERATIARQRVVFRDQMFAGVRADMVGADHPDVSISADELLRELERHSS